MYTKEFLSWNTYTLRYGISISMYMYTYYQDTVRDYVHDHMTVTLK